MAGTLPAGITLTGNGGLDVAGLEWLGARAYDPATRGFLSTDPTGLRPLTGEELKAYDGSSRGAFAAAGNWLGENWEYLAGGAMVIAGGVMIATGVGGPVGMMLVGAGADMIIQKATTGEVDPLQVGFSAVLGGFGGVGTAALASRAGPTGM
ncbi:hypothetical protein QK292_07515 [Arthrobacter sp. AL08]|uniref:hypothetical protein n=1 Tax=unclassified Arthrobacter TaxID=235627 RepID=UPI00249AABB0|nr:MULTISPECIES: hypothetical protein [unclassified Arthrobacter]MDI3241319.1 hypothetical protein [Arthrobacter sp. AL05]MDI3277424.1 hypothetical protein [Arthrobacter sp. AL08]